ncbi:MAG: hypothetical protein AAF289_15260 [Cyanobacteria bacterium P01_A01_bin.135]
MLTVGAVRVPNATAQVSNGGTQVLMEAFYAALQQPNISKVEALRLAQQSLSTGDFSRFG